MIGNGSTDIERYSNKDSEKTKQKAPLSHFIKTTDEYVPAELGKSLITTHRMMGGVLT